MGLEETWGVVDARVMSRLIVRDPRGLKKVIKDMKSRGRRQKQAGRRVDQWCKAGPRAGVRESILREREGEGSRRQRFSAGDRASARLPLPRLGTN